MKADDPVSATRAVLLRAARLASKRAIALLEEKCEQDQDVCELISAAAAATNAAMNCNQMPSFDSATKGK